MRVNRPPLSTDTPRLRAGNRRKREREHSVSNKGFTVWMTGLPSSGKSTLAGLLAAELQGRGLPVVNLDGDEVRLRLSKGLGFSKEDRDENIRRISYVARVASDMGGVAITSAISPYREIRDEARAEIARFVEVFVSCPVEVCIQRDVKGLYKKALAGEIKGFTGIDDPYEEPLNPELVVHTDQESEQESIGNILGTLERLGLLPENETNSRAAGASAVSDDEREGALTKLRGLGYLE